MFKEVVSWLAWSISSAAERVGGCACMGQGINKKFLIVFSKRWLLNRGNFLFFSGRRLVEAFLSLPDEVQGLGARVGKGSRR